MTSACVRVAFDSDPITIKELDDWMDQNAPGSLVYEVSTPAGAAYSDVRAEFLHNDQLVLFKLTWGGQ